MNDDLLSRIADALDRLAPAPVPAADLLSAPAYAWDGQAISPVAAFAPGDYDLLAGIDAQKGAVLENSRRLAAGHAAHDILLWGARGSGKSATVTAAIGKLQAEGANIALVQAGGNALATLTVLLDRLRASPRAYILYIDDLGFEDAGGDARTLRSLLQGGVAARPDNVRLYVTANRRHIVPRQMSEQDDPVNPRDVIDDKLALSDRFGLSLGFHNIDQPLYVAIVAGYAARHGLTFDESEAIQWATQRGSRSGRVAWQYVVELAGRAGKQI